MTKFNPQHKAVLDKMLLDHPFVRAGKMFGYPAYYAGRKLCICLYEGGVGVKLPAETVEKLLKEDPHTIPFQPLGRPTMRKWAQINLERSEDYRKYQEIFDKSVRFLLAYQGIEAD
jgi:hypothetical protein